MPENSEVWMDLSDSRPKPQHKYSNYPWILTGEADKNFFDDRLYEIDKSLRDWLKKEMKTKDWRKDKWNLGYRRTAGNVGEILGLGRRWNSDMKRLILCMSYYSTKIQKEPRKTWWDKKEKKVKYINIGSSGYYLNQIKLPRPYSLKLRYEEALEKGEILTIKDMKIEPKLKRGSARNKKTQATIELRRVKAGQAYKEWVKNGSKPRDPETQERKVEEYRSRRKAHRNYTK